MPALPSSWTNDEVPSAGRLNYDMYTYDSNQFHPTGVNYHTFRPLFCDVLVEYLTAFTVASSSGGTRTQMTQNGPAAYSLYDTSGLWGAGADFLQGAYQFLPSVIGSDGNGNEGGYYVVSHFIDVMPGQAASRWLGADLCYNKNSATLVATGGRQSMSTAHNNCAMFMDLVPAGPSAPSPQNTGSTFNPAVFIQDTSSTVYTPKSITAPAQTSGETSRLWAFWAAVNAGSGWGSQNVPGTPQASWPVGTSITSTVMTDALEEPLVWLGNPVAFRAAVESGQSIPNATNTTVQFPSVGSIIYNNNGNFSTSTYMYTIPVSGLYLFHGVVSMSSNTTADWFNAGALINGEYYWGPSYVGNGSTSGNVCPTKTQIFSLSAGDTVALAVRQNTGAATTTATTVLSRFMLVWLGGNGATIGSPITTYTVPDPSFRWQAGTPGPVLQHQFQQHLGNDIGFLFNKPYFMGYQNTATTLSPSSGTFSANLALQSQTGVVHADNGDPWSGWNATTNEWTAPATGWYLVVSEQTCANTNSPTDMIAGIAATTSGGVTPTSTPDWYQHILTTQTPTFPNGATASGLYYLEAGESVYIQGSTHQSGTSSTLVFNTSPSWSTTHMEIIWVGR